MSDVVATILILALTVTLFASIFAFVGSFPSPPPQNVSQFQARLSYNAGGSILGLSIEHLAGPSVSMGDHVFLESDRQVHLWQFTISGGIPVYWGLPGNSTSSSWNFGQNWTTTFASPIPTPDNITVYLSSNTQLLFTAVLPGVTVTTPPSIVNAGLCVTSCPGTHTTTVGLGDTFGIWAQLGGTLSGVTATVNLAGVPGIGGNHSLTLSNGLYLYNTGGGPTSAGTWFAVIYVENSLGQLASTSVPIIVSSSGGGGGGGGSSSQLSVDEGMSVLPPPSPIWVASSGPYFWGTVSYSGSACSVSSPCAVSVTFAISEHTTTAGRSFSTSGTVTGQSGSSLTGKGSVTVYSASTYYLWLMNSTATITATATVTGVGTATGNISFAVAIPSGAPRGIAYLTTSTSTPYASITKNPYHGCSSSNCPYLYYTLWNNFTTAGGPSTLTFNGTLGLYGNYSSYFRTYTYATKYTIGSTNVNAGSSVSVNVLGGSTRYVFSSELSPSPRAGASFMLKMWLTVKSGTTTVGYLYESFPFTLS